MAVNDRLQTIERELDFSAFDSSGLVKGKEIDVWTLADTRDAGEPDINNSFAEPERIVPQRTTFTAASPRFRYRFPRLSLTVLRGPCRLEAG